MYDKKIANLFGLKKTNGDVGIEIEMETSDPIVDHPSPELWRLDGDGSLKGYGYEFILNKPVKFKEVKGLISDFRYDLEAHEVQILKTIRAGIHVHINMQKSTLGDVFKFLACYYAFESVLTRFCGDGREGNLFCLRTKDAMGVYEYLNRSLIDNDPFQLRTDTLRYAAMNFQSLFKFGTLESRALATDPDLSKIEDWTEILHRIKFYSERVPDVWSIINSVSGDGPRQTLANMIGEEYLAMLDYPEFEEDVMEDVQNMQMFCYLLKEKGI